MTTQAEGHRHIPQLVPRRLLRSGPVHHPAVLEEARRRSKDLQELELKTNTELTRQIHVLTAELHRRFIRPT
jgi:hypothetical protein